MTEITQADRDAAGSLRPGVARFYARGQHDHCKDVKTFARHRMEATEALSAENERLKWEMRLAENLLSDCQKHLYGEGIAPPENVIAGIRERLK